MKINKDELSNYLKTQPPGTRVYMGADSERIKIKDEWHADFLLVVVVHEGGNHGAKVFGEIQRERDYDKNLSKPKTRLITEVYKISALYLELSDILDDYEVEIHLDLNENIKHGSSVAVKEAIGYIRGTCGIDPVVKPNAWCASHCADRLKSLHNKEIA